MAPTWIPHLKLNYGGQLGAAVPEIWSNTLRFYVLDFEPTRGQLVTAAASCQVPLRNWIAQTQSKITSQASLTYAKLNWVKADGKQRDTDTVIYDMNPVGQGGTTTQQPPFFQTQAVTFRTRVSRGRGHSGRVYPPVTAFNADSGTPYCTAADATAMATAYTTLVQGLREAIGLTWAADGGPIPDLAVFSVGSTTAPVLPALWTPVIGCVVDRVPDVQHRRTNRIPRSEGDLVLLDP